MIVNWGTALQHGLFRAPFQTLEPIGAEEDLAASHLEFSYYHELRHDRNLKPDGLQSLVERRAS